MKKLMMMGSLSVSCFMFFSCMSCNNNDNGSEQIPVGDPVETQPPNTAYSPAFPGQTRIGSVKTTTALQIEELASDLGKPWGIINLPDGRLLITEKSGYLLLYTADGERIHKIEGLPPVDDGGQGGLLDVAIDPDFNSNKMIYWTFSEPFGEGNLTSVAKGKLSADEQNIENPQVIYRAEPSYNGSLHYGGRLLFDETGHLFVSTGERSDLVTRPQAQDLNSALGKIVRITKEGNSAPGNPFANQSGARPEIYSYGHRNVQGLAIHPVTKDLWEAEFGAKGGDEINRIAIGKNYGWPVISYGLEYSGEKIGEGITQMEGMEQPVYYWDPSVSPSGIDFYTGTQIAEWKNNLFLGALSGTHIIRIVIHNNKVVGEERLLADKGERFRDVLGTHPNQSLYAITDSGKLFRISKQ